MNEPDGICECGCQQETRIAKRTDRSKNQVKGKPARFIRGHNSKMRSTPVLERMKFSENKETGCWEWSRGTNDEGYAVIRDEGGKMVYVHRWMYEQFVGPIPDGLIIDHLCRNRKCIHPDHLEPVTCAENTRRGSSAKITIDIANQIRKAAGTATQYELAIRFGVHQSQVSKIINGRAWRSGGRIGNSRDRDGHGCETGGEDREASRYLAEESRTVLVLRDANHVQELHD